MHKSKKNLSSSCFSLRYFLFQHALTSPEKIIRFEPDRASTQEFFVTKFQPVYFASENFEDAKTKMRWVKELVRNSNKVVKYFYVLPNLVTSLLLAVNKMEIEFEYTVLVTDVSKGVNWAVFKLTAETAH